MHLLQLPFIRYISVLGLPYLLDVLQHHDQRVSEARPCKSIAARTFALCHVRWDFAEHAVVAGGGRSCDPSSSA